MPIPRYLDQDRGGQPCELLHFCRACGWAIAVDRITASWRECRLCGAPLSDTVNYYPDEFHPNPAFLFLAPGVMPHLVKR